MCLLLRIISETGLGIFDHFYYPFNNGEYLLIPISSQQFLTGLRVLIVDDSEINRDVAELLFVSEGAHVILANDGQQAVEWLQAHPTEVDVVLMDVHMPVMNGYEATRQIRLMPTLTELPVIALTGDTFMEQGDLAIEAGMNGFITKPFVMGTTIELILKLTGWSAEITPIESSVPNVLVMDLDLPGLAVGYALSIWKDALSYQKYLRKFVRDYANCVQVMTHSEKNEAAALAHKLKGAAGSLGMKQVSALADEVVHRFYGFEDPADSLTRLQTALNTALKSIERYVPLDIDTKSSQYNPVDVEQFAQLFAKMLEALNTDSPSTIRPMLVELDKILPPPYLTALHQAVENFDFREGEAVIRALAGDLNILMEA